jgi:dihydrofolate synthase/folylpolyglutamate synthase
MKRKSIKSIKYIHVAGTNGKGSTCNYIAHGLNRAGYKTGLFTSPHVLCVTERITINSKPIPRERVPEVCDGWFQALWATALEYFAEQQVDYAVIETGIGGLHDCTNQITPILSVITKIGYDHMDLLGNTLTEIASHKAGIIKANTPIVTDPSQFPEAMQVIRETAAAKGSKLYVPTKICENIFEQNKIVATEALRVLGITGDFDVPLPPARMQRVTDRITVDGAHNYDAIKAVLQMIDQKSVIVFGMLPSKDYDGCIKLLDGYEVVLAGDVNCLEQARAALDTALLSDRPIFVCGSLYLAANVLKLFQG